MPAAPASGVALLRYNVADVGQVKLFYIGFQSQLGGIRYGRMEHSFRCLFIACRKGCFMHQNVCVLCGAHCLRTGFGIAEDGYYPSFFRWGEERFTVNDSAVVQCRLRLFSDGLSAATAATAGMRVFGFQIFGTWRSGCACFLEAVEIVLPKRVLIVRQSVEIAPIVKAAVVAV